MILFMVEHVNSHVLIYASDRETAKRKAFNCHLGHIDPDAYTVTPLTEPGDHIHLDITVSC